jgi:hypothetical protein
MSRNFQMPPLLSSLNCNGIKYIASMRPSAIWHSSFKNCVWTVYDTLAKKEWELRYVSDQSFNMPDQMPKEEKSARIISNGKQQPTFKWYRESVTKVALFLFAPDTKATQCRGIKKTISKNRLFSVTLRYVSAPVVHLLLGKYLTI